MFMQPNWMFDGSIYYMLDISTYYVLLCTANFMECYLPFTDTIDKEECRLL